MISLVMALFMLSSSALADSLYGTVKFKDGSKDKGTTRIATSWNGNIADLDGNGNYTLDLGGEVGKEITVYVNGNHYTDINVQGDTRLDITVP
jgi:hypothetical protein